MSEDNSCVAGVVSDGCPLLQPDFFPAPGPELLMEGVAENGEGPRPEFRNLRDPVQRLQRPRQRLLHEIVSFGFRSCEEAREGPQFRQQLREGARAAPYPYLAGPRGDEYQLVQDYASMGEPRDG